MFFCVCVCVLLYYIPLNHIIIKWYLQIITAVDRAISNSALVTLTLITVDTEPVFTFYKYMQVTNNYHSYYMNGDPRQLVHQSYTIAEAAKTSPYLSKKKLCHVRPTLNVQTHTYIHGHTYISFYFSIFLFFIFFFFFLLLFFSNYVFKTILMPTAIFM